MFRRARGVAEARGQVRVRHVDLAGGVCGRDEVTHQWAEHPLVDLDENLERVAGPYLDLVPDVRGREITTHGLTGDVAIVKSYVYDQYVRDGVFLVDLGWWIEDIEDEIWAAGAATVALPSRLAR